MNVVDKLIDQKNVSKSILETLNEMIDGNSSETKSMKNLIAIGRFYRFRCLSIYIRCNA